MSGIAAQRSVSFDTLAQSALPGSFDAHETGVKTTNKITDGPTMHLTFCEKFESKIIAPSAERRAPSAERRAPSAERRRAPSAERRATAPLAQAGRCPSSPPDRRPPVRGGGCLTFSLYIYIRRRPAGGSRAPVSCTARPRPLRPHAGRRGAARALRRSRLAGAGPGAERHHPGQQHRPGFNRNLSRQCSTCAEVHDRSAWDRLHPEQRRRRIRRC